jgi:hypothetical protein
MIKVSASNLITRIFIILETGAQNLLIGQKRYLKASRLRKVTKGEVDDEA